MEVANNTIVDGRYRILNRIGSGGMADVYLAEDSHLGRQVALKMLHRRFAQDQEFVERFRREASSAAGLQHPNVVNVFDRGEHQGTYYIAMEHLDGRTLKGIINQEAPLNQLRAIDIAMQILRAAGFAHRRGVIHRDFKPHNVIVDASDSVKVTDFGIARAGASEMTETGSIMGTAQYLSPEQAQGHAVTAASDLYSIGVLLYEMLTGRVPFTGDTAVSIALMHLNDPPPAVSTLRSDVHPALEAVVMKALAKDPVERFASADEFTGALEAARSQLAGAADGGPDTAVWAAAAPPTGPTQVAPAAAVVPEPAATEEEPDDEEERGRRLPLFALALLLIVLAAVGAYALTRPDEVEVPDVTGQPLFQASEQLRDAGLEVDVKRRPDPAVVDQVIDQDPSGGSKADEGSTVELTVSSGVPDLTIPAVENFSEKRAVKELTKTGCEERATALCGFKVELKEASSQKVKKGFAIRTSPPSGRRVPAGSRVLLFISTGPEQVEVPKVVGLARESAQSQLDDAGLGVVVKEQESDTQEGQVIGQDPPAGTTVDKGSRVTITVSTGPETTDVPSVIGQTESEAESELEAAGFRVVTRERAAPNREGIVVDQSPDAGTELENGRTVTIFVGREPEEEPPPPDPAPEP